MAERCLIEFPDTRFDALEVAVGSPLPSCLNAANSPILFGCRSGICGTCLVEVESPSGVAPAAAEDEQEALEIYAPGNPRARLACQLRPDRDLRLTRIQPQ